MSAFRICHILLTSLPPLKNCKAPLTPPSHCKPQLRVLPCGLYVRWVKRCFQTISLPAVKAFKQPIQHLDFYSIIFKGAYFKPFSESARNCSSPALQCPFQFTTSPGYCQVAVYCFLNRAFYLYCPQ
ncbi:unnamed protein product [Ixodes pacificus]